MSSPKPYRLDIWDNEPTPIFDAVAADLERDEQEWPALPDFPPDLLTLMVYGFVALAVLAVIIAAVTA